MALRSFLFVNKDCKSDSLSNSRADRLARIEIQQHAGNNANRKRSQRATAGPATSASGLNVFAPRRPFEALTTDLDEHPKFKQEDLLKPRSASLLAPNVGSRRKSTPIYPARQRLVRSRHPAGPRGSGTPLPEDLAKLGPRDRHMLLISPAPQAPISSVPNYLTTLTPREHQVLQHYASTWMPAHAGHGTTTGFTALSAKDMAFSSFVMQSALQTDDTFSLYAFLTMAAQRMHLTKSLPDRDSSPEYFSVRSVQALRSMASRPFSEELVLALANLVLGEAYIRREGRCGSPAVSIYRLMQRNLIIRAGGLHVLSPSTAQIAIAYDFYTSQGTLTLPYFDVYENPALLGIDVCKLPDSQDDRRSYIHDGLQSLDPALRVLLESCHDLAEVITAIGRLDSYAIKALTTEIWANVPKKLGLNAATLQRSGSMERSLSSNEMYLEAADALWMHIRQQVYLVWIWHTALGLPMWISNSARSESTAVSPECVCYTAPTAVVRALSQLWRQLDQVQFQLQHTGWSVRMKTVLWICALCFLTAADETEQQAYLQQLESSAAALEIATEEELRVLLSTMLPLEQLHLYGDVVGWLWNELLRLRSRTARTEAIIGMRHAIVRREEWLGRAIISECSSEAGITP